ncbi:hypothetical protein [Chitinimonas naiadis]
MPRNKRINVLSAAESSRQLMRAPASTNLQYLNEMRRRRDVRRKVEDLLEDALEAKESW